MMVGRKVNFTVDKIEREAGEEVLRVENLVMRSSQKHKNSVNNVSFNATLEWLRKGNFGIFESNENIKKVFESYKDLDCKKSLKKEYVIDYL